MNLTIEKIEHILLNVQEERAFFASNGMVFHSLQDLEHSLPKFSDMHFTHHVNKQKNDFSSWIRHVIGDPELADQVEKVLDKKKMARIVGNRIQFLKRTVEQDQKKKQKAAQNQLSPSSPSIISFPEKKPLFSFSKKHPASSESNHLSDYSKKLEEILQREREISKREEKILQIESDIEKKLASGGGGKFFTKEFIQGIFVGALILVIVALIIIKFVEVCL